MKKILAILLSTAMLVAMFAVMAVPTSAAAIAFDGSFDRALAGADLSLLIDEAYSTAGLEWRYHTSFKPTGNANEFEVVEIANPDGTSTGITTPLDVPAGGFVYVTYLWGGDTTGLAVVAAISVGSYVTITGLDLENNTVADDATLEVTGARPDISIENNVAYGKSYVTTDPYRMGGADVDWGYDATKAPTYPDETGKTLTDGLIPKTRSYSDVAWVGLHDGTPDAAEAGFSFVTIDLEGTYTLNKVVAYVAPNIGSGVTYPAWMGLVGYDNEGNAFDIGEFVIDTSADDGAVTCLAIAMDLEDVVADKIEVRITRGGFTFISEVAAYGVEGGEYPADDESSNDDSSNEDTSNEDTSNEDTSNEDTSNEDTSNEDTSNEDTSNEDVSNDDVSDEEEAGPSIEDLMGPVAEDAKFDVEIVAPETYVPGETFSVDFIIKNITLADGFDTFEFVVDFDTTKLELAEELSGSAIKVFNGFAEWEDLSKVEEGVITLCAGTAGGENGDTFTFAKNDGEISFTVDFTAKADATGDALIYVCNECPMGYFTDGGVEAQGNGSYAYVAEAEAVVEPTDDEPTDDQPVEPGDATSMIFFAIIALVAIAGSAVVIKTRR